MKKCFSLKTMMIKMMQRRKMKKMILTIYSRIIL